MDYKIKELKRDLKKANRKLNGLNKLMEKLHKLAINRKPEK